MQNQRKFFDILIEELLPIGFSGRFQESIRVHSYERSGLYSAEKSFCSAFIIQEYKCLAVAFSTLFVFSVQNACTNVNNLINDDIIFVGKLTFTKTA